MKDLIDDDNLGVEVIENKNDTENIENEIPWIEKYRPENINEVSSQDEIKILFNDTLKTGNLPHLLLHGPPGTGKTSSVLAIAKQLFGNKVYKERVFELNASDERGISIVREKITTISKMSIGMRDENYLCPDYRIIILDEADAMTNDAQTALRKTMEEFSNITRFCFICNYINQIIEPIASRCVKFRFKPINKKIMFDKLKFISLKEKLKLKDKYLNIITDASNGDMRKGITYLQNLKYIKLSENNIRQMCNIFVKEKCLEIIDKCKKSNIIEIKELSNDFKKNGYSINSFYRQLQECIIENKELSEKYKNILLFEISMSEKKLLIGGSEYIQLLLIFSKINRAFKEKLKKPDNIKLI